MVVSSQALGTPPGALRAGAEPVATLPGEMRFTASFALTAILALAFTPAVAGPRFPYTTIVQNGDISTARILFGSGAQGGVPGRDAAPVFTDIGAYQTYYAVVTPSDCDDACARRIYRTLVTGHRMDTAIVGERVSVLSAQTDSQDKQYQICRIRRSGPSRSRIAYILCNALADQP